LEDDKGGFMEKISWIYRYIRSCFQCKIIGKVLPFEQFRNHRIRYFMRYVRKYRESEKINEDLKQWIKEGKPFAVTRNGMAETSMFSALERDLLFGLNTRKKQVGLADFNDDKEALAYKEVLEECYRDSDVICAWFVLPMEEYQLKKYVTDAIFTKTRLVDLYDYDGCWIRALAGKKVLVVSPFVDTMVEQYKKRELLHKNSEVLPEFTLSTVKSVWWYSGGKDPRFTSWYEVLDYLYDECMKQDFDIALLSCSTFSSPLAVRLKKSGKQAIQMGGCLQLLFGIKGKRWDDQGIYNEHWVRLPENTKCGNVSVLDNTEGGIYW